MSRSCDRPKCCRVYSTSLYMYTKTRKVMHFYHLLIFLISFYTFYMTFQVFFVHFQLQLLEGLSEEYEDDVSRMSGRCQDEFKRISG